MKAIVIYESLWGNTAAVAGAIAEGLGPGARALSTSEATPEAVSGADLIVAGAPVHAFSLPSERGRASIKRDQDPPPDLSSPTLRTWLESLPPGRGRSAAFDTKFRLSPGSAAKAIDRELSRAGYVPIAPPRHFIVTALHGPLRDGEVEAAREWGQELSFAAV